MSDSEEPLYTDTVRSIESIMLITNPHARHGGSLAIANRAHARFVERGITVHHVVSLSPQHATELAGIAVRDAAIDALVVCGGDGMISLALQQQANSSTPLGIIPAGTGNDHGRAYGLPMEDPEAAADVVIAGNCRVTDLGCITSEEGVRHYYGTIMAAGFDSLVSDRVNTLTWPHGKARYYLALAIEFFRLDNRRFHIDLDEEIVDRPILLAAFGNTLSYGGGMPMCPNADSQDGLLDLTVIENLTRRKLLGYARAVFSGKHVHRPAVTTFRLAKARVSGPEMNAYADGELVCPLPVEVSIARGAGHYILPATSAITEG